MGEWNLTGRGEYESGLVGHLEKTEHLFSHLYAHAHTHTHTHTHTHAHTHTHTHTLTHTHTYTHTHTHRVRVFDHTVCLILYQMCLEVGQRTFLHILVLQTEYDATQYMHSCIMH